MIHTFKETVRQVPQVRAVIRLCSGPQYGELEGFGLHLLEEETQYCLHICTISTLHMKTTTIDPQTSRTSTPSTARDPTVQNASNHSSSVTDFLNMEKPKHTYLNYADTETRDVLQN